MTEIEIDKIIDFFLKNSKPVGKPYIWVSEEAKELLNEEIEVINEVSNDRD